MTWQELLAAKRVHAHKTSIEEIDGLRTVVQRDVKDAMLAGLSEDRRFATAYNAVLQLAKMAIACAGYRVSTRQGHHETTFAAIELALGESVSALAAYFDTCRRKRNAVDYSLANVVSEAELNELLHKAEQFRETVEDWIFKNHSHFAP
jgi:hypothetical protein